MNSLRLASRVPRVEAVTTGSPSTASTGNPAAEFAKAGWLVEVILVIGNKSPERRFFAVGVGNAAEAEAALLRYPGILHEDQRIARRVLALRELSDLRLRIEAIRPYASAPNMLQGS